MKALEKLDWVTERSNCSLAKVFETLKIQIQEDVDTRNKVMRSDGNTTTRFSTTSEASVFSVFTDSTKTVKSVSFRLSSDMILVCDGNNKEMFKAYLTLNDSGECRFKINNQEREFWQMRMAALENLLFERL